MQDVRVHEDNALTGRCMLLYSQLKAQQLQHGWADGGTRSCWACRGQQPPPHYQVIDFQVDMVPALKTRIC
jgi:hypothetical protein